MTDVLPAETTTLRPDSPGATERIARRWWAAYCTPERDPATRARLRRSRSALEAMMLPATLELARWLGVRLERPDAAWRAALTADLAHVLAHVREDDPGHSPMRAAGWKQFPGARRESDASDRPVLSEVRFRRLLQTERGDELVTALTRLIALLGGRADVGRLARDFLDWSHPVRGDAVRRRWAVDYYAAGIPSAPDDPPTSREDEA